VRRRLGTFTLAVSLLLTAALAVLWVRSYWVADVVVFTRRSGPVVQDRLWSSSGYLAVHRWEPPAELPVQVQQRGWAYEHAPAVANAVERLLGLPDSKQFLGVTYFDYIWTRPNSAWNGVRERALLVPHWLPTAACAAVPVFRLLTRGRRRRAARAAAGLCVACGYDRRGHQPGERCPECGAVSARGDAP
jgi:hypothetical protein